jgi:hypothetical protein
MRLAQIQKVTLWVTSENEETPVETLVNAAASNGMHVLIAESKEAQVPKRDYYSASDGFLTLTTHLEADDGETTTS